MANKQLRHFSVQPRNGAGPISVPGVKVGDVLILIYLGTYDLATSPLFYFEKIVTVDDEVQQLNIHDHSGMAPFNVYVASA
jgi:hypothetical protein